MPRISIAKAGDCVPKRGHAHEPFDAARTRWANGVRFVATSTAQSVQAPRGRGSLSARPNCSRPSSFKRLSCRQGDELEGGGLCPGYNTSANAKARWNREMAVAQDSYLGSRASGEPAIRDLTFEVRTLKAGTHLYWRKIERLRARRTPRSRVPL